MEEINLTIRKQFSIVDEGRENIMKITLNISKGYDYSRIDTILEKLGFYKQDMYERNHEEL